MVPARPARPMRSRCGDKLDPEFAAHLCDELRELVECRFRLGRGEYLPVVCGCGGGESVATVLSEVLARAPRLVLDADALNAIAADPALRTLLIQRNTAQHTVLTPHPLEAARLLGCDTTHVQSNRLSAAQELADRLQCTVVLKGSGTITAAPGQIPRSTPLAMVCWQPGAPVTYWPACSAPAWPAACHLLRPPGQAFTSTRHWQTNGPATLR